MNAVANRTELEAAKKGDDFAQDAQVGRGLGGLHGGVLGYKEDPSTLAAESFDGGLGFAGGAGDLSRDDVAVGGVGLDPYHCEVAVQDTGLDHAVALDGEGEVGSLSDQVLGEGEHPLVGLLGERGRTGGDAAVYRDVPNGRPLRHYSHFALPADLDRPRLGRIPAQVSLLFEGAQMGVDGAGGAEPHRRADFPHRGGIASLLYGLEDETEDVGLPAA